MKRKDNSLNIKMPDDFFDQNSLPDEWDEFWYLTHPGNTASWEKPDDSDELDFEKEDNEED